MSAPMPTHGCTQELPETAKIAELLAELMPTAADAQPLFGRQTAPSPAVDEHRPLEIDYRKPLKRLKPSTGHATFAVAENVAPVTQGLLIPQSELPQPLPPAATTPVVLPPLPEMEALVAPEPIESVVPPPLPEMEAIVATEPAVEPAEPIVPPPLPEVIAHVQHAPPPLLPTVASLRPLQTDTKLAPIEYIPLGDLTVAGYFALVNWQNDPNAVRHPPLAPRFDAQTAEELRKIPFIQLDTMPVDDAWSVAAVLRTFSW